MWECFAFFGAVLACVLLVERPWRNWHVHVVVEKPLPVETESEPAEEPAAVEPASEAAMPVVMAPELFASHCIAAHNAGYDRGKRETCQQLYNPNQN